MRPTSITAILLAACLVAAAAPSAHADPLNGRLSFTSFRVNGNGDIFTMNPDGSDQRALTTHPGYDAQSDWAPDGRDIAFRSRASGAFEVWRMDLYGDGLRQLTTSPARQSSTQPSWLPDKTGILYRRSGGGLDAEIWTMGPEGQAPSKQVALPGDQWYPSLSPDATTLLYSTTTARVPREDRGIFASAPDGSNPRTLFDVRGAYDSAPNWSPDGRRIAFESDMDGDMEVYVMNADGSDVRQLTDNDIHDEGPVWSPDGLQIAFTSGPDNLNGDIHAMNADGTDVRRITTTEGRDESPDWQPIPHPGSQAACGEVPDPGAGVSSVRASGEGLSCERAIDLAIRWSSKRSRSMPGFDCRQSDLGYGAEKVACLHRGNHSGGQTGNDKEVVFIHRAA